MEDLVCSLLESIIAIPYLVSKCAGNGTSIVSSSLHSSSSIPHPCYVCMDVVVASVQVSAERMEADLSHRCFMRVLFSPLSG